MKSILNIILLIVFIQPLFSQIRSNSYSEKDIENHVRNYATKYSESLVYWNLRKPEDDDGRVSRFRMSFDDFEITSIESVDTDMKLVHYTYNLTIFDSKCNPVNLGKQVASISIYCSHTKGERFSNTNFWTGVTTYGKEGDELYIKAIDASATPLYNKLFPHPKLSENWLRESCERPKPKFDNVDLEVTNKYAKIEVLDSNINKVSLLDYIASNTTTEVQIVITYNKDCMGCFLLAGNAAATASNYGLEKSVFLLSRDKTEEDFKAIITEDSKDYFLWSSENDTTENSFSTISNSSTIPDFFIIKNGEVKYYRQGTGNYEFEEITNFIDQALIALTSNPEKYPDIKGLLKN